MNNTLLSYNYVFLTISLEKYHYTDNRKGAPLNYFAYMEKGRSRLVSKNITLEINEGDIFFIPKGLPYQSYWSAEGEIRFKSFGFELFPEGETKNYLMQKIQAEDSDIKNIPTNVKADSEILGKFYSAVAMLLPKMKYDDSNREKLIVNMAKEYMYDNINCKISHVAKHCLVSESALYGIFKREAGMTPNSMKQKIICEKAVMLLTTTEKSVQEISDLLGFSSTSYFRKQLARYFNKTPREIRKENSAL